MHNKELVQWRVNEVNASVHYELGAACTGVAQTSACAPPPFVWL
jgi:hypothetical protein